MPYLDEHTPALNGELESGAREPSEAGEGGDLVALWLDPQHRVFRLDGEGRLRSPVHREVLARLLTSPGHDLYPILAAGEVARVWLGPSQSPVQVIFSSTLRRCADGSSRPAWAVAFGDVPDGSPTHRLAEARLRLLEGEDTHAWKEWRTFGEVGPVTLAG